MRDRETTLRVVAGALSGLASILALQRLRYLWRRATSQSGTTRQDPRSPFGIEQTGSSPGLAEGGAGRAPTEAVPERLLPAIYGLTTGALYAATRPKGGQILVEGTIFGLVLRALGFLRCLPTLTRMPSLAEERADGWIGTVAADLQFGTTTATLYKWLNQYLLRDDRPPATPHKEVTTSSADQSSDVPARTDVHGRYVEALEPVVQQAVASMHDGRRAYLGSLRDLAPNTDDGPPFLSPTDTDWLAALAEVVHQHGVSYELVTDETGGTLWLIPAH